MRRGEERRSRGRGPALTLLPAGLVSALVALSCHCSGTSGGPPPAVTPPAPAVSSSASASSAGDPSGPSTSRVAYVRGHSLCVQTLLPTAFGEAQCTDVSGEIDQLSWVEYNEIATLLATGDVLLVSAVRGEPGPRTLSLPPDATWRRPPPLDDQGKIRLGADPSGKAHLFVRGAEVWLARCPWWFGFDAGWCHEWVSVRLHPSLDVEVGSDEPPGFRDAETPSLGGAPPSGVTLTVEEAAGKTPSLVCERGGQKAVFQPEDRGGAHVTVGWSWVPGSATHYLATVTYDYLEAEQSVTSLMRACEPGPLLEDVTVIPGPGRFWLHDTKDGWAVLHGDREIGTLRGAMPQFAPEPGP